MNASEIKKFLAEHELFSGLPDEALTFLGDNAVEESFASGEVVARQGSPADRFMIVLDGELVVEVPAIAGPALEITRLGPGQVFGWSWLIEPFEWRFHARASSAIRVLDFNGRAILRHCEQDPVFGYALFKRFSALMGSRLESAQRKMMDQWSPSGFA
jgi:CRP-like cAMP-binding protein